MQMQNDFKYMENDHNFISGGLEMRKPMQNDKRDQDKYNSNYR